MHLNSRFDGMWSIMIGKVTGRNMLIRLHTQPGNRDRSTLTLIRPFLFLLFLVLQPMECYHAQDGSSFLNYTSVSILRLTPRCVSQVTLTPFKVMMKISCYKCISFQCDFQILLFKARYFTPLALKSHVHFIVQNIFSPSPRPSEV